MEQNCSIATILSKQNVLKSGSLKKQAVASQPKWCHRKTMRCFQTVSWSFLDLQGFF